MYLRGILMVEGLLWKWRLYGLKCNSPGRHLRRIRSLP